MAAAQPVRMGSILASLFPRLSSMPFASAFRSSPCPSTLSRQPIWPSLAIAIPLGLQMIPRILEDLWEGILKAVPKKKTSHMKRRHRQMAGKALKDVTALNKCPACGQVKRMHLLCPVCMHKIQGTFEKPSQKLSGW